METGNNNESMNEMIMQSLLGKSMAQRHICRIANHIVSRQKFTNLAGELNVPHSRVEYAIANNRESIFDASFAFLLEWKQSKGNDDAKAWRELLDALTIVLPKSDLEDLLNNLGALANVGQN